MQSAFTRLRLVGCQTQSDNVIEAGSLRALIDPEAGSRGAVRASLDECDESFFARRKSSHILIGATVSTSSIQSHALTRPGPVHRAFQTESTGGQGECLGALILILM